MSSQSPQRNRKPQMLATAQGPMQAAALPREASPSPSFLGQMLANSAQQGQQPSPTTSNSSHQSRRTPPPTSRISPTTAKLASGTHLNPGVRDRSPQRLNSPPPLIHAHSQPVVTRPTPRVPPPQFLTQYQPAEEKWQMTPELMADIERADQVQGQLAGTMGVAYAGGAASSHLQHSLAARDPAVERVRANDRSSPKDRVRDKERDRDVSNARESPKTRERSQTTSSIVSPLADSQLRGQERSPDYRGSPQYQSPMASPGERTAAYAQYVPDSYQSSHSPTGPVPRKPPPANPVDVAPSRATPPAPSKLANQTPPLLSRPPDRSLPVQEEPEEDVAHNDLEKNHDYLGSRHASPTPSSELYPDNARHAGRLTVRNGIHPNEDDNDEDDVTLNEEIDDHDQHGQSEDDDNSGFTPRSPSTNLPERLRDGGFNPQYTSASGQYQPSVDNQKTVRVKPRAGPTDQLGMRGFDAAMFENSTIQSLRNNPPDGSMNGSRQTPPSRSLPQSLSQPQSQPHPQTQQARLSYQEQVQQQQYHDASRQQAMNHIAEHYMQYGSRSLPANMPNIEDMQSLFDDPTSSYLQSFLQSPRMRPNAPIPPTPQTQTAAPSPSPAISSMPSEIEARQVGSPYPYPFGHIRRTAVSAAQNAPSSTFDPNHPSVVREQLALQMQIYALNNGLGSPSESAFSPASTPFPGPGYNPWAFVHQAARPGDSNMSLRSSPSHEPVPMPMPPLRGRGVRRKEQSVSTRPPVPVTRRRVKPPPRVESTQPRDTSPEPSSGSGEETAGEDSILHQYIPTSGKWPNGVTEVEEDEDNDDGEWVDDDDEAEDDLLQLEYHPSFVYRTDKRRRRWDTRWAALAQAFQALDRETDATLVLLAAPSHSSKLHSLTSRSIRRDAAISGSKAMSRLKGSFNQLAAQRKASRTNRLSLFETLSSAGSPGGSSMGGENREEDLRQALNTALASLGAMGSIYEQREARWRDEMRKLSEDREHVELLLRQALGPALANGHDTHSEETA
ncbi:unnamed protein product [Somion occarium]|uniref:Uncharacterized protein n=1 Tax=Somion occarium TaxID=3059160 RepID=A0ABP1D504_9APHY